MNIGWPGSVHDARVLANSSIYAKCENNKGFDQVKRSFDGVEMTPFFIDDAAYPLLPWLIKPFRETSQLSDGEKHFNYSPHSVRTIRMLVIPVSLLLTRRPSAWTGSSF